MTKEIDAFSKALKALPIGGPYIMETDDPKPLQIKINGRARWHRVPIQTARHPLGVAVYRLRTSADRLNLHPERWWDTGPEHTPKPEPQPPLKPRGVPMSEAKQQKLAQSWDLISYLTKEFGSAWFRSEHVSHPKWTKYSRQTLVAAGFLNRRLFDRARLLYEYQVAAL